MILFANGAGEPVAWLLAVLFIVLVGVVAVARRRWPNDRTQRMVDQWAARQDFKLLSWAERGRRPFVFATNKPQLVFRITARFRDGRVVAGWVRCGSVILGLLGDDVEVRWDGESNATRQPPSFPVILPPDQSGGAGKNATPSEMQMQ